MTAPFYVYHIETSRFVKRQGGSISSIFSAPVSLYLFFMRRACGSILEGGAYGRVTYIVAIIKSSDKRPIPRKIKIMVQLARDPGSRSHWRLITSISRRSSFMAGPPLLFPTIPAYL